MSLTSFEKEIEQLTVWRHLDTPRRESRGGRHYLFRAGLWYLMTLLEHLFFDFAKICVLLLFFI